jgi:hypothetical protein
MKEPKVGIDYMYRPRKMVYSDPDRAAFLKFEPRQDGRQAIAFDDRKRVTGQKSQTIMAGLELHQWVKEEFHLQSVAQDLGLMAVAAAPYPHIDFLQRHDVGIQRPDDPNRRLQPDPAVPVDAAVDVVGHDANDI